MSEEYEFEVGDQGLDYDILDKSYNPTTQKNILNNGLKEGMTVLDVGCGSGVMTVWLAEQVGPEGRVVAIDNSPEQLKVTQKRIQTLGINNVETKVLSAYDIADLTYQFDAIYCRFLLHHLHSPRATIASFFNMLKPGGLCFLQDGLVHNMWAYPDTYAWRGYLPEVVEPELVTEGDNRDGDFGMKLFYVCHQAGFTIKDCQLHQPILWQQAQKEGMISGILAFKKTDLAQGMTEEQWQEKYQEALRLIRDPNQVIGFYGSCFVAAEKP